MTAALIIAGSGFLLCAVIIAWRSVAHVIDETPTDFRSWM